MVRAVAAVVWCWLVVLGACSGQTLEEEDDTPSGGKPSTSPAQKCQTYASTWCNRAFGCYVEVGRINESERQRNVDQCSKIIVDRLPCSDILSVSSDYETCISQITGMACANWDVPTNQFGSITPPNSCDEALSF